MRLERVHECEADIVERYCLFQSKFSLDVEDDMRKLPHFSLDTQNAMSIVTNISVGIPIQSLNFIRNCPFRLIFQA